MGVLCRQVDLSLVLAIQSVLRQDDWRTAETPAVNATSTCHT